MASDRRNSTSSSLECIHERFTASVQLRQTSTSYADPSGTFSHLTVEETDEHLSVSKTIAVISCITCITGIGNLLAGLLTVCIPVIAKDIHIPSELQLWPTAAFALACGCTLIPCGAAADVLGCRRVCLLGGLFQAASALGAGLAQTTTQLIALRATAGLAASFCLPSAVGVAAHSFPVDSSPRRRSVAFAAMGGGQAVGFGLGLALGGVFADTVGWRWGFYATALLNGAVLALALWSLPHGIDGGPLGQEAFKRLAQNIDWVGALLISACLALFSYALAIATGPDASRQMREPLNLVLLCIALALIPAFALWMQHQTRLNRPALIPNKLWVNVPFTTVCIAVFLIWGMLNASEQLTALYLQDIRGKSTLTTSLYFMPAPVCGLLMNVAIAALLPYLRPSIAVPAGCFASTIAPLLLAVLCRIDGPSYWRGVFQAMALNPLGADLMYTIANLVITSAFPIGTQALAGGVFNMLAQIGKSVGIATSALISEQVRGQMHNVSTKEALLLGYKAGWWYNCSLGFVSLAISYWGLRSVKRLEIKRG
ncbi:low affinity ammonium transporter [Trichomonascus vanleenenianus]|uniref:low affinity ammonium transporter n=1 Tax=Trichomonascus vanleenenianus TaxID=2268995 RepID=UPI003ECACFFD